MIKRVFHGYKIKQTSTKKAPLLVPVKNKNSWQDHADFPKYFRNVQPELWNIWLFCKATSARWELFPRTAWWPGGTLASKGEAAWLLGKPEWNKHLQTLPGLKCCVFTIRVSGLLSCGKTKPQRLTVPSPRWSTAALSSCQSCCALWEQRREEQECWFSQRELCCFGRYWSIQTIVMRRVLKLFFSSNTSLGLFMKLLREKLYRSLV